MNSKTIDALLNSQRNFFQSGATLPVSFRIDMLKKLYAAVKKYENEVTRVLKTDLGKSDFEGFMCETGLVLSEISYIHGQGDLGGFGHAGGDFWPRSADFDLLRFQ